MQLRLNLGPHATQETALPNRPGLSIKKSSSERYHLGYPEVHQVRGEPPGVSVQGPAKSQKERLNRHDSKYTHSGAKRLIMSLFKLLYWLRLLRLDTQGA